MNKIYKVIYNKVRNCYVVASEIAKSTGKSTSGSKQKAAALLCAAVLCGGVTVSAAGPNVTFDDTSKTKITLTTDSTTVDILGVAGGNVYSGSTHAANGDDVWQLQNSMSTFSSSLDSINTSIGKLNSTVSANANSINDLSNTTSTLKQKVDRGYAFQINGLNVKTAVPNDNEVNFETGNHVSITNDNGALKFAVQDDGKVETGNTGLVTGGTVYTAVNNEQTARENADNDIKASIGTLGANGSYIQKSESVATNLTALDTQVKKNADDIAQEITNRNTAIDKAKSELDTKISDLNTSAVQYDTDSNKTKITLAGVGGTTITNLKDATLSTTSTDAVTGRQLYKTNTDLTAEIQARKDAITAEETARTNAIQTETNARVADVKSINDKLGTLADGSYIKASGTFASNLTALDTQVKANATALDNEATARKAADAALESKINNSLNSLSDNAVQYDTDKKTLITLDGAGGTVISNVKAGTLDANSTEAVNGAQLFKTNTDLTNEIQARKDAIGTMGKDGSYILAQGTVSANLTALDTQVKKNADDLASEITNRKQAINDMKDEITGSIDSLTDNAVKYKENTNKGLVELGGAEGTKITNLKDATLSTTSSDAVTGRQLNQTNLNLTQEIQDRKDAIDKEVTDRNAAIKTETDARVAADKAITDKLGSMGKDGSYVLAQGTVADNLSALDKQVKANETAIGKETTDRESAINNLRTEITNNITSLSGNAVQYKDDTKGEVELTGRNGTIISGVKAGTLDANSTEAVNGAQLFQTNTNLTQEVQDRKDAIAKEVTDRDTAIATAVKAETDARTAADTAINNKIGNITKDGAYIGANDTISSNLSKLDVGVKANKDALDAEIAARKDADTQLENRINTSMKSLSDNAVQYTDATKDLVKLGGANGTVLSNVKAGLLDENSMEAVNGSQLWDSNKRITNNTTAIRDLTSSLSSLRGTVQSNSNRLQSLSNTISEVNSTVADTVANLTSSVKKNANLDLSNLSEEGMATLNAAAKNAVQNYMKTQNNNLLAQNNAVNQIATLQAPIAVQATTEAVTYDDTTKSKITLGDSNKTVDILGVTGNAVYKGSTHAANGDDVYAVQEQVNTFSATIDNINSATGKLNSSVAQNATDIAELRKSSDTLTQKMNRGYNFNINGITAKSVEPNDNDVNFKSGDNVTITNDNGSIKFAVEGNGEIGKGNTGLVSGDTAYKALEEKANKDLSNLTEEAKNQIKNTVSTDLSGKANVGLDNLSDAGIQKVKDIMSAGMKLKADTSLTNLTTDGVNQIKSLAKGSVKLVDGTGTKVSSTFDEDGNISYAVNINTGDIAQGGTGFVTADSVKAALATKANLDATNIDAGKYAEKLGTGVITDGDTSLVTGGTVYNAIKNISGGAGGLITKVDVDMGNISNEGKTVIKNLAKDAVKIADGKYTTVSNETDNDGNITYRVNVTADGTIEDGNTGLITGDVAKKALDTKANNDLDNISDAGKDVIKNTMKDDLDKKADKDLSNLTEEAKNQIKNTMAADLEGKANIDASNVGKYATEWANALGTGKIEKGSKNLVTGDMVYNAVSVKADKSYVDEELAKKANADDVNTALAGKADTDLSNISDAGKNVIKDTMKADMDKKADKDYVDSALAGKVDKADFDTVKGQVDKNTADIANKADKSYVDDALSKKADADKVYTKEETDAKIDSKIDDVKDTISGDLENKVNKDASNIEKDKWQETLGDGKNEAGNKGLINGDTLHTALDDLKKDGVGLVKQDGDTIKVAADSDATKVDFKGTDKDGNRIDRVLTGIKTDEDDMSSAANVGYVQGVASNLETQMDYMNSRLTNDIKEAGAVASALAGLHHIDYDPDNKLDFAVSTAGYRGKSAAALGAFYQPNENVMFSLAGTIGSNHNAWNAGISFKIGHGSDAPVLSRRVLGNRITALAQQNQYLADRNEKLEQDVQDMQRKLNALLAAIDVSKDVQKDMTAPATK